MNTNYTYIVGLLAVFWLPAISSSAQHSYRVGMLPSINFNKKLKEKWSANFKVEGRHIFGQGEFGRGKESESEYVLTDHSGIIARKLGVNSRLAGGYLLRLRGEEVVHRTIQQYATVRKMLGFRVAHRLASDQTFEPNQAAEFRFRYRTTYEVPLSGRSVDVREPYLKINNEYLSSFQGSSFDLELRVVPLIGYKVRDSNKVEAGLDYRVDSFLEGKPRHSFWLSINWYIEI